MHNFFKKRNFRDSMGRITGIVRGSKKTTKLTREELISDSQSNLWSNKANLSSAFKLSHKSLSERGSKVIIGLKLFDFR